MPNSPQSKSDMKKYAAEQDLHMLIEAAKIRGDKGRHSAAMAAHKKRYAELASVGNVSKPRNPVAGKLPPDGPERL